MSKKKPPKAVAGARVRRHRLDALFAATVAASLTACGGADTDRTSTPITSPSAAPASEGVSAVEAREQALRWNWWRRNPPAPSPAPVPAPPPAPTPAPAPATQVRLAWVPPGGATPVSGTVSLSLTGAGFRNVEIFSGGVMIARAEVSSDMTRATAQVDTRALPDGSVTLTAHAWNSPAGSSFTSEADAGSLVLNVRNAAPPAPPPPPPPAPPPATQVSVAWVPLTSSAPVSNVVRLSLTGQAFRNVEIFNGGSLVARALVSGDFTQAVADVDTRTLPNGQVTLTAHAWNSPAGTSFTSEADAGSLVLNVNNVVAAPPPPPPAPPPPPPPPPPAPPPPSGNDFHPTGYSLVFSDEFSGASLDRSKWCTRYIYGGGATPQVSDAACQSNGEGTLDFLNDEQQRYVDTNRQGRTMHDVSGGLLTMWATNTRNDSYAKYESAMIRSKQLFRPTSSTSYYITARLKLPSVKGSWPAFWLNSDRRADGSVTWPPEIDIIDAALNDKDDTASMLHQAGIVKGQQTPSGNNEYTFVAPEFDTRWQNYRATKSQRDVWVEIALEWKANEVCYYVDGYRTNCHVYRWVENGGAAAAPAHLLLNLAVGGGWAGRYGVDDARFPMALQADYVRVYKK